MEHSGFLFPNDVHILWQLMIVIYPYVTGVVAGAFIVSSLYHVFGRTELRPVAKLAMVASLAFLAVATTPLLMHLGHPDLPPLLLAVLTMLPSSLSNRRTEMQWCWSSNICLTKGTLGRRRYLPLFPP